jgi:hypothetical protein
VKCIIFTLHKTHNKPGWGWISSTYIDGCDVKKKFKFGGLSSFDLMLVNISLNETPIEIDITDEDDIDNSYDVDI